MTYDRREWQKISHGSNTNIYNQAIKYIPRSPDPADDEPVKISLNSYYTSYIADWMGYDIDLKKATSLDHAIELTDEWLKENGII